jgi:hypothetical protein
MIYECGQLELGCLFCGLCAGGSCSDVLRFWECYVGEPNVRRISFVCEFISKATFINNRWSSIYNKAFIHLCTLSADCCGLWLLIEDEDVW